MATAASFPEPALTVRALLESQAARLIAVLDGSADSWIKAQARRYLGRVNAALLNSDGTLDRLQGSFGENGWEPAIRDVERQAAWAVANPPRITSFERVGLTAVRG